MWPSGEEISEGLGRFEQKAKGDGSEEPGARASSGVGDSQHRGGAWWARTRVQGKEEGGVLAPQTVQGSESTISLSV